MGEGGDGSWVDDVQRFGTEVAPALEVANLFESHNINRVPVLDKNLHLAGIIARSDLVQAFC